MLPNIQVAIHSLWSIRIVVLVKPEHENRISHVFSDSVKTGIANTLGKQFHFSTSHLKSCPESSLTTTIHCDVYV